MSGFGVQVVGFQGFKGVVFEDIRDSGFVQPCALTAPNMSTPLPL